MSKIETNTDQINTSPYILRGAVSNIIESPDTNFQITGIIALEVMTNYTLSPKAVESLVAGANLVIFDVDSTLVQNFPNIYNVNMAEGTDALIGIAASEKFGIGSVEAKEAMQQCKNICDSGLSSDPIPFIESLLQRIAYSHKIGAPVTKEHVEIFLKLLPDGLVSEAREAIEQYKEKGEQIVALSGGLDVLIEPTIQAQGIDIEHSQYVESIWENGVLMGINPDSFMVQGKKDEAALQITKKLKIKGTTVMHGDGGSDARVSPYLQTQGYESIFILIKAAADRDIVAKNSVNDFIGFPEMVAQLYKK